MLDLIHTLNGNSYSHYDCYYRFLSLLLFFSTSSASPRIYAFFSVPSSFTSFSKSHHIRYERTLSANVVCVCVI